VALLQDFKHKIQSLFIKNEEKEAVPPIDDPGLPKLSERAWDFLQNDCGLGSLENEDSPAARLKAIFEKYQFSDRQTDYFKSSADDLDYALYTLDDSCHTEASRADMQVVALNAARHVVHECDEVLKSKPRDDILKIDASGLTPAGIAVKNDRLMLEGAKSRIWDQIKAKKQHMPDDCLPRPVLSKNVVDFLQRSCGLGNPDGEFSSTGHIQRVFTNYALSPVQNNCLSVSLERLEQAIKGVDNHNGLPTAMRATHDLIDRCVEIMSQKLDRDTQAMNEEFGRHWHDDGIEDLALHIDHLDQDGQNISGIARSLETPPEADHQQEKCREGGGRKPSASATNQTIEAAEKPSIQDSKPAQAGKKAKRKRCRL